MRHRMTGILHGAVRAIPASLLLLALLPPAWAGAQEPYPPGLYAEVATPKGVIVLSLYFDRTPMTVANFVGLAEGTIHNQALPDGTPFYDGTSFHRVAPGHVIQAGRPASEVANTPGYSIPNEIVPGLGHGRAGMVGMANSGPHTGKCQWYITLGDRSYLDGDYTVFGEVYAGMDVVYAITPGDPIESVRIVRVGRAAGAFRPTSETFREMRREVWSMVRLEEEEQLREDLAYIEASWPHAVAAENGLRYVLLREGSGSVPRMGDTIRLRYVGRTLRGLGFVSTADTGVPHLFLPKDDRGEPFSFVVGEDLLNPGFDEGVAGMRVGERRLVIVPAELGYDPVGFYGTPREGEPRFVIRPRSILVYEVERLAGGGS